MPDITLSDLGTLVVAGLSLHSSDRDPAETDGRPGDHHLNLSTAVLFRKAESAGWQPKFRLRETVRGLPGLPGAPGRTILPGAVAPTTSDGAEGDFFLRTTGLGSPMLYGPKAGGAWPAGVSLAGPVAYLPLASWQTATAYAPGPPASTVSHAGSSYVCLVAHTSGTFATDLVAGRWGVLAAKGADGSGTGTVNPSGAIADGDVALFDGTTGTLIKSGGGAASAAEIRTGTNNVKRVTAAGLYAASAFVPLTDAASIAVDMATFLNAKVTLAGNRTLGNPTNAKEGQSGVIRVVQDGTGSRTLSYGSAWKFAGGAPTLSTAAGAVDVISYVVVDAVTLRVECSIMKAVA